MRDESQFVGRNGIVRTVGAHSSEDRQSEQRNRHRTFQLLRAVRHNHRSPLPALATRLRTHYRPMDWCIERVRRTCVNGDFPPQRGRSARGNHHRQQRGKLQGTQHLPPFLRRKGCAQQLRHTEPRVLHHNGGEHGRQEHLPKNAGRELHSCHERAARVCRRDARFGVPPLHQYAHNRRPYARHQLLQCRTAPTEATHCEFRPQCSEPNHTRRDSERYKLVGQTQRFAPVLGVYFRTKRYGRHCHTRLGAV